MFFLWRACRNWTRLNLITAVAFFVLAIFTKFSALILGPVFLALVLIARPTGPSSKL